MWISGLIWSTWRKPAPVPLCPPQTPHDLTWAWTWATVVGSLRLTVWAMSWPRQAVTRLLWRGFVRICIGLLLLLYLEFCLFCDCTSKSGPHLIWSDLWAQKISDGRSAGARYGPPLLHTYKCEFCMTEPWSSCWILWRDKLGTCEVTVCCHSTINVEITVHFKMAFREGILPCFGTSDSDQKSLWVCTR
jgi:hypothetical protein